eukprot:CAMPEP_0201508486 /NCGR_PEP_ID=MMETSP0161_2-20130828/1847_1 /ASSEMBLY_ACC=CAM_ASM_000251 /TAXON_ID=180227 /ORGANISM="Neoparamoeba aestuarina, Strain SoJaBio B1-5/56/2" /LENGTH=510 /DNA_ID=CAMNT_0047903175 /DNA_START=54 /DNA_END=1586 /DNA_ORIENTATION=-
MDVEVQSWLPSPSDFNITDFDDLKAKLQETGRDTLVASSENLPKIAIPLVIGWALLFVVDFVVTFFIPKGGKKDKKGSTEKHTQGVFFGNGPIPMNETLSLVIGYIMLGCLVPIVGGVVGLAVLWDYLDRAGQGRPQDGIMMSFARFYNRVTNPITSLFTKYKEDGFIMNVIFLLGVIIPTLLFLSLHYTLTHGFNIFLCVAYHIFRIGPYFMNFAYCYTLCHKEGHSRLGLYSNPVFNLMFRNAFNWWIGLFYGVLPSSFACGHSINHHKYNNGPLDVVSTADKPRDSFKNFVRFMPRWALYALNVSTIRQFVFQKDYKVAWRMLVGTIFYAIWIGCFWRLSPVFTFWYLIFPVGENILLLACIQWCWHGFVDPNDPENPFVGSITLIDGPINVLGEDFHVVHHQYPGVHWATHPDRYKKHEGEYQQKKASAFRDTHTFEMFFFIILAEYKIMAERFVDFSGKYDTQEKKEQLIKDRLSACWWGPLAKKKITQHGWEGVEDSDGYTEES